MYRAREVFNLSHHRNNVQTLNGGERPRAKTRDNLGAYLTSNRRRLALPLYMLSEVALHSRRDGSVTLSTQPHTRVLTIRYQAEPFAGFGPRGGERQRANCPKRQGRGASGARIYAPPEHKRLSALISDTNAQRGYQRIGYGITLARWSGLERADERLSQVSSHIVGTPLGPRNFRFPRGP